MEREPEECSWNERHTVLHVLSLLFVLMVRFAFPGALLSFQCSVGSTSSPKWERGRERDRPGHVLPTYLVGSQPVSPRGSTHCLTSNELNSTATVVSVLMLWSWKRGGLKRAKECNIERKRARGWKQEKKLPLHVSGKKAKLKASPPFNCSNKMLSKLMQLKGLKRVHIQKPIKLNMINLLQSKTKQNSVNAWLRIHFRGMHH